jgi:putative acetyltransferase
MTTRAPLHVDPWNPSDAADRAAVAVMVGHYHQQTESEKGASAVELPDRYRAETEDPVAAFAGSSVLLARGLDEPLGMLVLTPSTPGWCEVKRLWVETEARGRGAAKHLLMEAAHRAAADGSGLRLSVWEWRTTAIALYERLGFTHVPSWDSRAGLVCLERPADG